MKRRLFSILAIVLGLMIIGVAGWQLQNRLAFARWLESPLGFSQPSITVTVERGMTARAIGNLLAEEGVVPSLDHFRRLMKVTLAENKLRAGLFIIPNTITPRELADLLQSGTGGGVRATLVEGWSAIQMASELTEVGLIDRAADFMNAIREHPRRTEFTERESLEGFLYPDTYFFIPGQSPEEIIDHLLSAFENAVNITTFRASAEAQGLTLDEAVTLASIVEREARIDAERDTIAGVFLNRLDEGMKLESCATVHHAIGDWSRALSIADTQVDHPFNTYVIEGLPPAPICNPGLPSLMAVVSPEVTDKLFFVYDENLGRHRFSRTYREHQRAISATRGE